MSCADYQDLLVQGLDGTPSTDAGLEQHLRQCAECRALAVPRARCSTA